VGLHGRLGEHELLGDLGVRQPARDELEDLELPRGELLQAFAGFGARPARRAGGGGQAMAVALEQPPGDPGSDDRLAGGDRADGGQQLGGLGVLEQKTARARS
jgi:hypothetical protein